MSFPLSAFHIMAKPTGSRCNIDCDYCYFLHRDDELYPQGMSPYMSDETLEKYIKNYIESQASQQIVFSWQGGEPTLLGLDFFKKVIKIQKSYAPRNKQIVNDLQTNGILLNNEWCQFLKQNQFFIGVSIDGPKEIHDHYRVSRAKKGTFEKVMTAIKRLNDYQIPFATLTCITQESAPHALDIYRFLRDNVHAKQIQLIPIVQLNEIPVENDIIFQTNAKPNCSVKPLQWGEALCAIFDEWYNNDVGKVFLPVFEGYIGTLLGYPASSCIHSKTCGQALAIMPNGDLFSCDHYIYDDFKLGNIHRDQLIELANLKQQVSFGESKYSTLAKKCIECDHLVHCYGGCPKDRIKQGGFDNNINYLCEGLSHFFSYTEPKCRELISKMNIS